MFTVLGLELQTVIAFTMSDIDLAHKHLFAPYYLIRWLACIGTHTYTLHSVTDTHFHTNTIVMQIFTCSKYNILHKQDYTIRSHTDSVTPLRFIAPNGKLGWFHLSLTLSFSHSPFFPLSLDFYKSCFSVSMCHVI